MDKCVENFWIRIHRNEIAKYPESQEKIIIKQMKATSDFFIRDIVISIEKEEFGRRF